MGARQTGGRPCDCYRLPQAALRSTSLGLVGRNATVADGDAAAAIGQGQAGDGDKLWRRTNGFPHPEGLVRGVEVQDGDPNVRIGALHRLDAQLVAFLQWRIGGGIMGAQPGGKVFRFRQHGPHFGRGQGDVVGEVKRCLHTLNT